MTVCVVGEDPFRHLFSITPLPSTITCPNVTFPEVTTCIHETNPCTKTPNFWKVAATCPNKFGYRAFLGVASMGSTRSRGAKMQGRKRAQAGTQSAVRS